MTGESSAVALALWAFITAGHFVLTRIWVGSTGAATRDERFFVTMLAGVGTLMVILHALASAAALSIAAVGLSLGLAHAVTAIALRPREKAPHPTRATAGDPVLTRILEAVSAVVLAAVVLRWVLVAVPTLDVAGTDAAHYHVPNAVNVALGGSIFDLPPTSHLYPMGSSVLAAWFIVPGADPLLIDLAMVLPFLLLCSAGGWIFRLLTGQSGLAWLTPGVAILFSTPLFRTASLVSADLLFTASTCAFGAALLAAIRRRRLGTGDLLLIALSGGLLLGAKTTGVAAAGLLALPALMAASFVLRRPWPRAQYWIAAAALVVAAGGVWLLRNWWIWGSPLVPNGLRVFGIEIFEGVPFERTTYLSVLGDLDRDPNYRLTARFAAHAQTWLGGWFLPALAGLALVAVDAGIAMCRGRERALAATRIAAVGVALATAAAMMWTLAGAPWTSLEWTRGLSLRYVQPWWALLPLLAWIGLFPLGLPWYRRATWTAIGAVALWGIALLSFDGSSGPFPPGAGALDLVIAAAAAAAIAIASRWRRRLRAVVSGVALIAMSIGFGTWSKDLRQSAITEQLRAGPRTGTRGERVYQATLAAERDWRRFCTHRRFFSITRFDEPLALQGVVYTNRVHYAARDVGVTAAAVNPPIGSCDYVITSRAVLETPKGEALVAAMRPRGRLVEAATVDDFLVLAVQ